VGFISFGTTGENGLTTTFHPSISSVERPWGRRPSEIPKEAKDPQVEKVIRVAIYLHCRRRERRGVALDGARCRRPFGCTGSRIPLISLWRRPPTGHSTLCNAWASVSQGDALCRSRTRKSMRLNACAWRQTACNWWATLLAPLCSGTSFGWRECGRPERNGARVSIQKN